MSEILTLERASDLLGLKARTLADKARAGEIPAYKRFNQWYFLESDLVHFIKTGKAKEDKPYKPVLSASTESKPIDKERQVRRIPKPVSTIKTINRGKIETEYTRAAKRYPKEVEFMLSDSYISVADSAERLGLTVSMIKKIRKGMKELGML